MQEPVTGEGQGAQGDGRTTCIRQEEEEEEEEEEETGALRVALPAAEATAAQELEGKSSEASTHCHRT